MPKRVEQPEPEERRGLPGAVWAVVAIAGIFGTAFVVRSCLGPEPETSSGASAPSATEGEPGRCVARGEGFTVGDAAKPDGAGSAAAADLEPVVDDPMLMPFAVVVGRAVSVGEGFAVATLNEGDGGTIANIVRVGAGGAGGSVTKLSRIRGDLDPPAIVSTGNGDELIVAWLEPNASSRSVRLAKLVGTEVTKGAEIPEGRDESSAIDVASLKGKSVVVWDSVDGDKSYVALAGFDNANVGEVPFSRRVTGKDIDADSPRLVATADGYFLAYLEHGRESDRGAGADGPAPKPEADAPEKPTKKKKGKGKGESAAGPDDAPPKAAPAGPDEVDESRGGESIGLTSVMVMQLDASGNQRSDALRVSPQSGTVAGFDMALAADGSLVVAYRDDDAPTGGVTGGLSLVRVGADGSTTKFESADTDAAEGIPTLLPGWLSLSTLKGADVLTRLGENGLPKEPLFVEPSLGRGEPIAAFGTTLLLAEPLGKAMRFITTTCSETSPQVEAAAAASAAAASAAPAADE